MAESKVDLLPPESMALTVGLAQVLRGEPPADNIAILCVLALARLDGRYDWDAVAYQEFQALAEGRTTP